MSLAYRNTPGVPSTAARRALRVAGLLALFFTGMLLAGAQAKPRIEPKAIAATELTVFAAADMKPVFDVLGLYFERRTGIKLKLVYGASATLAEQVDHGAPADIFFSADFTFAERVVAAGRADNINPYPYAKGLLVLWARNDSRFKPLGLDALSRGDLKSVAIANPEHAPYGRAAMAALAKLGYLGNVQPHLVQAESVGQAAQFGLSGNAELALISQTLAYSPAYKAAGTSVMFPLLSYPDIRQCAVIVKDSPHRDAAHVLLNYITSDDIQDHLADLGLQRIQ